MSWDRKFLKKIDEAVPKFSLLKMATIPVHNPVIPFLGFIPGGVRPGLMVRIKGVMPVGGHRFMINLQTGCVIRPRDDVALHLSVRSTEHCIVRNHMVNQVWGTEERHGGMPVHPGQLFDILILTEGSAFKIAINNVHYCMFQYRIPFHRIQFVHIEGQVSIHSISLEGDNYQPPHHVPPVAPIYPTISQPTYNPPPPPPPAPHWSVGAVPVLPTNVPPPMYSPYPTQSQSPYPPGANPAAWTPAPATAYNTSQWNKKKKSAKVGKTAAIVGGVGLGAAITGLAISRALGGGGGDDDGEGGDDDCAGDE